MKNPSFFDTIEGRSFFTLADRYFEIPYFSSVWGHRTFRIQDSSKNLELIKETKLPLKPIKIAMTVLKVASYFTIVVPLIAMVFKVIGCHTRNYNTGDSVHSSKDINCNRSAQNVFHDTMNQRTLKVIPVGFSNHGNSCWFAAALQILLASRYIEGKIREPLQKKQIEQIENGEILPPRDETDEEFQKRKNIQEAFIRLIDQRKVGDVNKVSELFKDLHQAILQNLPSADAFPKIGESDAPSSFLNLLHKIFEGPFFSVIGIDLFVEPSLEKMDGFDEFNKYKIEKLRKFSNPPQIITIHMQPYYEMTLKVNEVIDLSVYMQNGEKARYQIVGFTDYLSEHYCAYAKSGEKWYFCDDDKVREVTLDESSTRSAKHVVLEIV